MKAQWVPNLNYAMGYECANLLRKFENEAGHLTKNAGCSICDIYEWCPLDTKKWKEY